MILLFQELETNPAMKAQKLEADIQIREAATSPDVDRQKAAMEMQIRTAESGTEQKLHNDQVERAIKPTLVAK